MTGWTDEARKASAEARRRKAHGKSPSATTKRGTSNGKTLAEIREAAIDAKRTPEDRARIAKARADIDAFTARMNKTGTGYTPAQTARARELARNRKPIERGTHGYPAVDHSKGVSQAANDRFAARLGTRRKPKGGPTFHPIKNPLGTIDPAPMPGDPGRKLSRSSQRRRIKASVAANQRALRANKRKRG